MEKRDTVALPSPATPRDRLAAVDEGWLDCALEDTFPASDPIATRHVD